MAKLSVVDLPVATLRLKPGREKPLLNGHPWVFSGAVERLENYQAPGQLADVYTADGRFCGRGYVNTNSQIVCRILTSTQETIDRRFFEKRLVRALALRRQHVDDCTNAYRLVNSEGDFLPGLIVDVYGPGLVCQFLTAGMERQKDLLLGILEELLQPEFIFERSDTAARNEEGLPPVKGLLRGALPENLTVRESDVQILVDVAGGQKTGFYLDQRENRRLVQSYARDRTVLDCFSYTGGFSLFAARGGARSVTAVDTSAHALELVRSNFVLNGFGGIPLRTERADVFTFLRQETELYDLIILDPPSFARAKSQVPKAARGYKDINLLAFHRLNPGGLLFTFSCSHFIEMRLFRQIVFAAAADAGRPVQVLKVLGHSIDHPVSLFHPEGDYLKGLLLRVVE